MHDDNNAIFIEYTGWKVGHLPYSLPTGAICCLIIIYADGIVAVSWCRALVLQGLERNSGVGKHAEPSVVLFVASPSPWHALGLLATRRCVQKCES